MDKLYLDTNFLLDLAVEHRPGGEAAAGLFEAIAQGVAMGVVSPSSIKDFYYVARRDMPEVRRREWIALFMDAFIVAKLDRDVCERALFSDEPDFEDGMVRASAELEGCRLIISRDETAFAGSSLPRVDAAAYLASLGGGR